MYEKFLEATKSYSNMLSKITLSTTLFTFILLSIIFRKAPLIKDFLNTFDGDVCVFGINASITAILISILVGILFRSIKMHNCLAKLFGIRNRFDVEHILKPMAKKIGVELSDDQMVKLKSNREKLMDHVFYKYASSSSNSSKIDPHYIFMALDQWTWFWMFLEALLIALICSLVLILVKEYYLSIYMLSCAILLLIFLWIMWRKSKKYANTEITQILEDEKIKTDILGHFNDI